MKRFFALLIAAGMSGTVLAGWEEAVNAYNSGDYATAAKEFRPFAEQGQATAQYILGWIYQTGDGVKQDYSESAKWYAKAADKGNADAQYAVGSYYMTGVGVPQDNRQAMLWFRKAADQGKAPAQYLLGYLLARGEGIDHNEAESSSWYLKAAVQGYAEAQYAYALALAAGAGVEKDEQAANDWLRKAADQKHTEAAYLLGWNYEKGVGMLPDYAQAAKWYRQAADAHHVEALYHLATLLRDGRGVAKDDAQALELFRKAAEAGQTATPAAIDEYLKSSRFDNAFALAETWLAKNPDDVQLLTVLGVSAANEARSDPARFSGPARSYGDRAIALVEADKRPASMDEAQWNEYRTRWLPQLHLRLGVISQKSGQIEDARERFTKVTQIDPKDPYGWYFLGQTHFSEYEKINAASKGLDGPSKSESVAKAFAQLDRVIEYYARAIGLAAGKEDLREPLLRDLQGIYEFRNGSRMGFDDLLAKYRQ